MGKSSDELKPEGWTATFQETVTSVGQTSGSREEPVLRTDIGTMAATISSKSTTTHPRRVKLPIFKGQPDEDADTHLAKFEEMLRANHEQNDETCLELFPSSLDKDAFVWYTQFALRHFKTWEPFAKSFLHYYRKAKEETDLYSIIHNMKQKENELVQSYIGRMKVAMRRLNTKPSDAQRISWLRRSVREALVTVVEQNPTSDADEYERKLIRLDGILQMLKLERADHFKGTEKPETGYRARGDKRNQTENYGGRKFCYIHNRAGHDTKECKQNNLRDQAAVPVNAVDTSTSEQERTDKAMDYYNPDRQRSYHRNYKENGNRPS
ncbi:unnamed protein product [Calypogeia fissa]